MTVSNEPKATYYALVSDDGTIGGILRRTHVEPIPLDETFRRDLTWRPSQLLRKYHLGSNDMDFEEISAEEASNLTRSWSEKWAKEDAANMGSGE
ncbi:MAG: hypothetical protein HYZ38_06935 [Mycobacterium sp.]|nr:hypothetical protein [Mycobacterium sp.]